MDARRLQQLLAQQRSGQSTSTGQTSTTTQSTTTTPATTQVSTSQPAQRPVQQPIQRQVVNPQSVQSTTSAQPSLPSILRSAIQGKTQAPVQSFVSAPSPAPAPAPVPAPAPASTTTSSSTVYVSSPNRFTNRTGVSVSGYAYELTDNLADGDCFFSAIYQTLLKWDASQSGALFKVIKACEPRFIVDNGESAFIKSARDILADTILAGALEPVYNRYLELFLTDPDSLPSMMADYQGYFQRIILDKLNRQKNPKQNFYSLQEFNSLIANEIRKSKTWVSELEVDLFRKILEPCNILLNWYSDISIMPKLLPKMYDNKFILNIHVIRGRHWEHYVLKGAPTQITLQRLEHSFMPITTPGGGRRKISRTKKYTSKKRLNKSRKH
jgi:hypothetical protein